MNALARRIGPLAAWRFAVGCGTLTLTAAAVTALYHVLRADDLNLAEAAMLVVFVPLTAWIALSFFSGLIGFHALRRGGWPDGLARPAPGNAPLPWRSAVLVPVYNEDEAHVFANVRAMRDALAAAGHGDAFDVFVLSDTTDPRRWVAEELAWARLKRALAGPGDLFYRHRRRNVARKSGNIADFCRRWGGRYETMVVLDADSLIAAETFVAMVRLMEANPAAGIVQVPCTIVRRTTLFGRLQQFASRLYGPLVAAGMGAWQGPDGNFYGHNAIIRTRAFAACCGLPDLPGHPPFGGHILSHDFVEAALILRGGWQVWSVPALGGSFEESPPTLVDYALRDRRWCQGNLQHARVIGAHGFKPVSRIHMLTGIMSYLASPLWLVFLVAGIAMAWTAAVTVPDYFKHSTLFPAWPVYDTGTAITLFVGLMACLLTPKALALAHQLMLPGGAAGFGGPRRMLASAAIEILVTSLVAPIMMLIHTRFVVEIVTGRDSGWGHQRRDGATSLAEAARRHAWHTAAGLGFALAAAGVSGPVFWLALPLALGLVLSIPLSWLLAREDLGLLARRHGLFLTPEETDRPEVVARAEALLAAPGGGEAEPDPLLRVLQDPEALALHIALLGHGEKPTPRERAALATAMTKLHAARGLPERAGLTAAETGAVLHEPALLEELALGASIRAAPAA